jgi:hypothetical protein
MVPGDNIHLTAKDLNSNTLAAVSTIEGQPSDQAQENII